MDDLLKKILFIAGYAFAGLLIAFTSIQTYSLLYTVSGDHITAAIGLVLFEAGMIYWWSVFRREAVGLLQMAISGLMFIFSLVMVVAAVALHLGAIAPGFLGSQTPARIIILAVLANLIAKLVFPLVHPDVSETINDRAQEGRLLGMAEKIYNTKMDDDAHQLADELAAIRKERARAKLYEDYTTRLNRRIPAPNIDNELEVIPFAIPHPNGRHPED